MTKNNFFLRLIFIFILINSFVGGIFSQQNKMIVTEPVADVWMYKPGPEVNNERNTQVLLGNKIVALKEEDGYLKVQVLDQEVFARLENKWIGCPGWIEKDQVIEVEEFPEYDLVVKEKTGAICDLSGEKADLFVSIGTKLKSTGCCKDSFYTVLLPDREEWVVEAQLVAKINQKNTNESVLRESICKIAKLFEGMNYTWGGRSSQSGVDCSGLVGICYQAHGKTLPRNSCCQYQKCKKIIDGSELKPSDLIFLSKKGPDKISHVMIYLGGDQFIEAAGMDIQKVVVRDGEKVFGRKISELRSGDETNYRTVYFGTYF